MVYGHRLVANSLLQAVTSQQIPQALLITGPPKVGKTTMAQAFAMTINCLTDHPPCGQCQSCRKIQGHNHPDVMLFDDTTESLKIEQVRELQRNLVLKPIESHYKLAIFSQFERATLPAANALLKTLEEPPRHAILILTAHQAINLLPTIVSRCQVIKLKPIPGPAIAQALRDKWGASSTQADLLSRLAAGRLGWAGQPPWPNRPCWPVGNNLWQTCLNSSAVITPFGWLMQTPLPEDQKPCKTYSNLWLTWWRDLLLLKNGASKGVINIDQLDQLSLFARQLGLNQILNALDDTFEALKNLNYNVNIRLNFEVLLLRLTTLSLWRLNNMPEVVGIRFKTRYESLSFSGP